MPALPTLMHRLPVAVTLLSRTIFYGLALILIPAAALVLVEGAWPSPTQGNSLAPMVCCSRSPSRSGSMLRSRLVVCWGPASPFHY